MSDDLGMFGVLFEAHRQRESDFIDPEPGERRHHAVERETDTVSGTVAHRVLTSLPGERETWDEMGNCTCPSCRAYKVGFDAGRSSAPVKTEYVEVEVSKEEPKENPWLHVGDLTDELSALYQERHTDRRWVALYFLIGMIGSGLFVLAMLVGGPEWIAGLLMAFGFIGAAVVRPPGSLGRRIRTKELELKKAQRRAVATEVPPGID